MANPLNLATGDVVDETWVDAVSDHVTRVYTSTAARDAELTSPFVGQTVYLSTNDEDEGLWTYTSASEWQRPWNTKWPAQFATNLGSDQNMSSTSYADVTGLTLTVDYPANRNLLVAVCLPLLTSLQATTTQVDVQVYDTAASVARVNFTPVIMDTTDYITYAPWAVVDSVAGSRTWKIILKVNDNAVGVKTATYPSWFRVEDLGPSGAPA